jgi:hypothetical protein
MLFPSAARIHNIAVKRAMLILLRKLAAVLVFLIAIPPIVLVAVSVLSDPKGERRTTVGNTVYVRSHPAALVVVGAFVTIPLAFAFVYHVANKIYPLKHLLRRGPPPEWIPIDPTPLIEQLANLPPRADYRGDIVELQQAYLLRGHAYRIAGRGQEAFRDFWEVVSMAEEPQAGKQRRGQSWNFNPQADKRRTMARIAQLEITSTDLSTRDEQRRQMGEHIRGTLAQMKRKPLYGG